MLTLIGNNGFKRFNLAAILGAGFNYYDFGDNDPKYTRVNTISGNFSIQASYNVNRKFSVFIEPGLKGFTQILQQRTEQQNLYAKQPHNRTCIYFQR